MINNNFENALSEMSKNTDISLSKANTHAILALVQEVGEYNRLSRTQIQEIKELKESFQSIISSYARAGYYLKVSQ